MDEMKNALKGNSSRNLDGMIKRIDFLFTSEVMECPFPSKFWLPQLETFDEHSNPLDHLKSFKILLNL